MADPRGFLTVPRRGAVRRPVALRVRDWREVYEPVPPEETQAQASRCMDCGVPFCHHACPLGNLIPEWNDLVWRGRWRDAWDRLETTNNFPDFTGRLCPAPCEAACVVGIADQPVSIELVEKEVAERAEAEGFVRPRPPARPTARRVAIVGSGPAGLAAAQQLARAGHVVSVYERAERPGGLLRYGIPEFKLEKAVLDRRLAQLVAEGVTFHTGVEVGVDLPADELAATVDAVVLAVGATQPRDLPIPGRELPGILQAMEYLPAANRAVAGGDAADLPPGSSADARRVVIIGGGDTGADCLGTAHRQGAVSVAQLEIMPRPPGERAPSTPWPLWPLQLRTSAAHEEGGERRFSVSTQRFLAGPDGRVAGLVLAEVEPVHDGGALRFEVVPGTEETVPCELVLLALGFTGPERAPLLDQLGLVLDEAGRLQEGPGFSTSSGSVFCCGDARRGQSLVVWAIAEGRSCAAAVDAYLEGESTLPAPAERPARAGPARGAWARLPPVRAERAIRAPAGLSSGCRRGAVDRGTGGGPPPVPRSSAAMEASVTDGRRRDKEQLMAEMSRRKFLQHGSLGVAAAAALATVPNVARSAFAPNDPRTAAASTAGAAGVTGDAELATGGPVMVHLADARTGEIHLYVGERELTRHDPALAAAIARAARG